MKINLATIETLNEDNLKCVFDKLLFETQREFNGYFNLKGREEFYKFIIDNTLYAYGSSFNTVSNGGYNNDLILPNEIKQLLLENDLKFFNQQTVDYLISTGDKNIVWNVDEDYDVIEKLNNKKLVLNRFENHTVFPTFPTYDMVSDWFEDKLEDKSYNSNSVIWKLMENYENLISHFYIKYYINHRPTYQFGGYPSICVQHGYRNILGFVNGGYGDAGAMYSEVTKNGLYSWVDMH